MAREFGPRRGAYVDISEETRGQAAPLSAEELASRENFDLIYRSLCAVLYNYVPMSGHPGGSISSGRFVASILFGGMDYDFSNPDRADADLVSYAAGHKALGLYGLWALRNEMARAGDPSLLPSDARFQLRWEDLLGFRRNPTTRTPLFLRYHAKPLDGHPTPATPFVKLSTGASGVGVASSIGLAFGARDYWGKDAPRVHIVEGEGGLTPGRVVEALAAAGTASLDNVVLHLDWNQASIDTNRVCRDDGQPGDYVQWNPQELFHLHDWNVIYVPDGFDLQMIAAAQRHARAMDTGQPTAIVYRTHKGWQYGIEGRASHGAGHKMCSEGYFHAMGPLHELHPVEIPQCPEGEACCLGDNGDSIRETCFWAALTALRGVIEKERGMVDLLSGELRASRERLEKAGRRPRENAPRVEVVYAAAEDAVRSGDVPEELVLQPGSSTTLRGALGSVLGYLNRKSHGSILTAAADLLDSTSVSAAAKGFDKGYWHPVANPNARLLSIGGICEDAIAGVLSGAVSYGHHIGVGSSYGAFIAPLGHIAARLHGIGAQGRKEIAGDEFRTMVLVCAHAGLKTGEDGPTHADPQPLQILQENFPPGMAITLTPWDPQEMWPLVTAGLARRPALLAPFVTRPNEKVLDRAALGLAPASAAAKGVYRLRAANGEGDGTIVLQGSGVTYAFVEETLPLLEEEGIDLDVYYVASAELFDALPEEERREIFPEERARAAMGITGFTLPTLYRWVTSEAGRRASLYPFRRGHFLGSGQAAMVLREAGLDGEGQLDGIREWLAPVRAR